MGFTKWNKEEEKPNRKKNDKFININCNSFFMFFVVP